MSSVLQRGGWYVTLPTAAAVIVFALMIYLPNQKKIELLRGELRSRQQLTGDSHGVSTSIQRMQRELEETQAYVDRWQANLPRAEHGVRVQAEITDIAAESDALTTQISPGAEIEYRSLIRMPLAMELTGSFHEVFDFLGRLERLPRMIWVDKLQLKAPRQAGEDLECRLDLVVFRDCAEISD